MRFTKVFLVTALILFILGAFSNLLVQGVNGNKMPVIIDRKMIDKLGEKEVNDLFGSSGKLKDVYICASESTHLNWFGDWIKIPVRFSREQKLDFCIASPGDLMLYAGFFLFVIAFPISIMLSIKAEKLYNDFEYEGP